jgi:hypothetical protein
MMCHQSIPTVLPFYEQSDRAGQADFMKLVTLQRTWAQESLAAPSAHASLGGPTT